MHSLNFEILRVKHPQLSDLGGFAEQYAYSDPEGAIAKLRIFSEALTHAIYSRYGFHRSSETFFELLSAPDFESSIPPEILDKFHSVRKAGNRGGGTHPTTAPITKEAALERLKDAHDLANWWALVALNADIGSLPVFTVPPPHPPLPPEVQEKLREQGQRLDETVAELEKLRKQIQPASPNDDELKAIRKIGQDSANQLRLVPDEHGMARGVRLFRYLAEQANRGKAVGIGYGDFVAFLHGKQKFEEVAGRTYKQGDSAPVISLALGITKANGGRIRVTGAGRTIESGMDTYIWPLRAPHERHVKAFDNPKAPLPYSHADWKFLFPEGRRRLIKPGEVPV